MLPNPLTKISTPTIFLGPTTRTNFIHVQCTGYFILNVKLTFLRDFFAKIVK